MYASFLCPAGDGNNIKTEKNSLLDKNVYL